MTIQLLVILQVLVVAVDNILIGLEQERRNKINIMVQKESCSSGGMKIQKNQFLRRTH